MATIKSFSDLQQSKKLAKILPLESADMYYPIEGASPKFGVALLISTNIPCWSLAALFDALPYGYSSILTKSFNGKDYYCKIDGKPFETLSDNPIDACYDLIIKLNELKML